MLVQLITIWYFIETKNNSVADFIWHIASLQMARKVQNWTIAFGDCQDWYSFYDIMGIIYFVWYLSCQDSSSTVRKRHDGSQSKVGKKTDFVLVSFILLIDLFSRFLSLYYISFSSSETFLQYLSYLLFVECYHCETEETDHKNLTLHKQAQHEDIKGK